jgi:tripartite-type tricarboxylate transporter receptor subunit TctC
MRKASRYLLSVATSVALALGLLNCEANADDQFYQQNRSISLIVAGTPGAGYDLYARLLASHMSQHISGNPSIVLRYMGGANGIVAANYLYNAAPPDGSTIALLQRNITIYSYLEPNNVALKFNPQKFAWLGSIEQERGFLIMNTFKGQPTLKEIKSREFSISSTSADAPATFYAKLVNAVLGTKLHTILGYDGIPGSLLAVERGEVDGTISGGATQVLRARLAPEIASGKLKVLMTMATTRDPEYPSVPTALELANSDNGAQALKIAFAPRRWVCRLQRHPRHHNSESTLSDKRCRKLSRTPPS